MLLDLGQRREQGLPRQARLDLQRRQLARPGAPLRIRSASRRTSTTSESISAGLSGSFSTIPRTDAWFWAIHF